MLENKERIFQERNDNCSFREFGILKSNDFVMDFRVVTLAPILVRDYYFPKS